MIRIFAVIMILLLFFSCKSTQDITPQSYTANKLHFGSGGGFAGIEKEYILLDNGQLYFKISRDTTYHKVAMLDKNLTNQFFSTYDILRIDTVDINQPSNQYYFLQNSEKENKHKLIWGMQSKPNDEVLAFYTNLISIAKKNNSIK